ncbi:ABC transporter substrate-binding protein [Candidatus Entotheonella palauensis]|uniref:ABC transporter substrate-binding protein n=1 Tax=Candidatus Entotheonella palauensis TaxID=93172 RepID=UPI000B7DB145|nr:ABC transporter substrate-binding protein [Candidatus Entotheonella palauensis]
MQLITRWLIGCLGMALAGVGWAAVALAQDVQTIYAGTPEGSVWLGVKLGEHEANILGRFTGQTYTVKTMDPAALLQAELDPLPTAIAAATDVEQLRKLSAKFAPLGVAVFNIASDDDALRQACLPGLLHTPPTARMKADAVAQWKKKKPEVEVEASAWHPDFKKFAARDLNNRFRKAHNVPMDSEAWAGWAALKMVSEAVARAQSADPKQILTYLREEMEFDGQKGIPHTFRDTGQLRQPLLMVVAGKLVGEAPVRGVVDTSNLDSLGLPSCK